MVKQIHHILFLEFLVSKTPRALKILKIGTSLHDIKLVGIRRQRGKEKKGWGVI